MSTEQRLTNQVIRYLRKRRRASERIWWMKLHGSAQQLRGVPDLLVIVNGRTVFIELKAPGEKPTPLQQHRISEIRFAGCEAAVCRTLEEVRDALGPRPETG